MIYDSLENITRYYGLSKHLDIAIDEIRHLDLPAVAMGQTKFHGDDVFCNHFCYTTKPQGLTPPFEAHELYLDLHLLLEGQEYMVIAPTQYLTLERVIESEDSILYSGEEQFHVPMDPCHFLLVYPGEGHHAQQDISGESHINKIVFKLKI